MHPCVRKILVSSFFPFWVCIGYRALSIDLISQHRIDLISYILQLFFAHRFFQTLIVCL